MGLLDERLARLQSARLYLVCEASFAPRLDDALRGGVDVVQLRDKHLGNAELLSAAAAFRAACSAHDALFVVNDRPDIAAAASADGAHVGQDDMDVGRARELAGPDRLIGLSTHTPAQVDAAGDADYIGVGPVHATPTKPGRPAAGLELVAHAAGAAPVPFFAIGGVHPANVATLLAAGATRIAVVRAITEARDPEEAARDLRAALEQREPAGAGHGAT